jgi:hypothetical protein
VRRTRRELIAQAALAAGAAIAGSLEAPAYGRAAAARAPVGEAQALRQLAAVEQLAIFSYEQALEARALSGAGRSLARQVLVYERAHLRALAGRLAALGALPPAPPGGPRAAARALAGHHMRVSFARRRSARGWLGLLFDVEELLERNYHTALAQLRAPALLELCAEIYASEAQHGALLGELLHPRAPQLALPDAFVNGS